MADVDLSQLQTLGTVAAAVDLNLSQFRVMTAINFPSDSVEGSQYQILVAETADMTAEISQLQILAVVRGRIENRKLRCWTFSLDGHDFYVLRLGETDTLVYDVTTQQWAEWTSPDLPFWRAGVGMNWAGMGSVTLIPGAMSDAVAGDDTFGLLWTLNPEVGYDDNVRIEGDQLSFQRRFVGGVPIRLRNTVKTGAVYLTASVGNPQLTGASITLRTSDDQGKTWVDHGTITAEVDNFSQEFVWRSLGLIKAPGRIFEITDNGATVRIDSMDMR